MNSVKIKDISLCAAFAAVISVLSMLAIPTPIGLPMTLQVFAVALAGFVVGSKGAVSAAVYILIGAMGVPVFSGMQGGVGHLLSPTGGFLWSFPILALMCGLSVRSKLPIWILPMLGLLLNYAAGGLQMLLLTQNIQASTAMMLFFFKDVVLLWLACKIGLKIRGSVVDKEQRLW